MPTPRHLLSATLATSLLLTSGAAEARFGKRSNSDDSSSEKKEKKSERREERRENHHEATPVGSSSSSGGSSRRHEATPVSSSNDDDGSSYSGGSGASYSGSSRSAAVVVVADSTPMYPYSHTPRVEQQAEPVRRGPVVVRLGVEGQSMGGGGALALNLGVDGKRWGVNGALTSLTLPTDDGTAGEDKIGLYSTHLTYALLSSDEGRLRLEGGVAVATAPDVTFVGPSIAASFERCLGGALDLEGRAQLVPVPYTQLDAQAGLALNMGLLTVRGGWRWLLLNDRGAVDGETHEDVFAGPYAGIGLHF